MYIKYFEHWSSFFSFFIFDESKKIVIFGIRSILLNVYYRIHDLMCRTKEKWRWQLEFSLRYYLMGFYFSKVDVIICFITCSSYLKLSRILKLVCTSVRVNYIFFSGSIFLVGTMSACRKCWELKAGNIQTDVASCNGILI